MSRIQLRARFAVMILAVMSAVTVTCLLMRNQAVQAMPAQSAAVSEESDDPLTRFRTERGQLRQMEKSQLNDIIHDDKSAPSTVSEAQRRLMDILEWEDMELEIEEILTARGFREILAVVRGETANILVRGEAVSQRESAVILDLVLRQTGITGGNVKIIPIK